MYIRPLLLLSPTLAWAAAPDVEQRRDPTSERDSSAGLAVPKSDLPSGPSAASSPEAEALRRRLLKGTRPEPRHGFELSLGGGYTVGLLSAIAKREGDVGGCTYLSGDPASAGLSLRGRVARHVWVVAVTDVGMDLWCPTAEQWDTHDKLEEALVPGAPQRWIFGGRLGITRTWGLFNVWPEFGVELGGIYLLDPFVPLAPDDGDEDDDEYRTLGFDGRLRGGVAWFPVETIGFRVDAHVGAVVFGESAKSSDEDADHLGDDVQVAEPRFGANLSLVIPLGRGQVTAKGVSPPR